MLGDAAGKTVINISESLMSAHNPNGRLMGVTLINTVKILICCCVQLESPDFFIRFWVMQFMGGNQPYPQPPSEKTGGFDFGGPPLPYRGGKESIVRYNSSKNEI